VIWRVSASCRAALVLLILALLASSAIPSARAQGPRVLLAEIDGPIDRSTVDYIREAIDEARVPELGYSALMIRLDTPGGGLDETTELAQLMNNAADVPILGWVGPVGAQAWSAGTILLVSTDLAAMAPGTTIGSVQPVIIGPTGVEPVTDSKIINAVVNLTRTQLGLHNRSTDLAERFVVENLNLNASEALALGAIEIVAATPQDFLGQADGRRLVVQEDSTVYKDITLSVSGAEIVPFGASARVRLLAILADPLVASLALILGIYLLIFGLSAPGHGAEIAGAILLLLALVGLGFSVDPIALLLIVFGIILILVELKTPGFGAFGAGGIIAIIIGAVFLAPLRPPRFVVSPEYQVFFLVALLVPTASFGGFLFFAVYKVLEIRRRKPTIGMMVAEPVRVVDPVGPGQRGYVRYRGELWQATSEDALAPDEEAFIQSIDGIQLRVARSPPPAQVKVTWWDRVLAAVRRRIAGPPNP
jgi:membrane-bound serine protease (ClpP class)